MTVKLYEGCWGVTRSREKRGPMPDKDRAPFRYPFFLGGVGWGGDGRRNSNEDPLDIIAVFATEADADAYLAGENADVIGDMVEAMRKSPQWDTQRDRLIAPPAPKPVTWPDGVDHVKMGIGPTVTICDGFIDTTCVDEVTFAPTQARQLAALLLAAADYVEGRG